MNRQGLIYTIIFTFIVSFLFVLVLAVADQQTQTRVLQNETIARQRAILNALSLPADTIEEVQEQYAAVEQRSVEDEVLYRVETGSGALIAKEFAGAGLWGTISGVIGVTEEIDRVTGIEIIDQNETPGLGARIDEDWFKRQLAGERIVDGTIRVGGSGDGDYDYENGTIDAITGATRTSESLQKIFTAEIDHLKRLIGGGS